MSMIFVSYSQHRFWNFLSFCGKLQLTFSRTMSFKATKDRFLSMNIDEKRKQYKCGDDYVTLEKIDKWSAYDFGSKVSLFRGDITTLEIDAIVNAANVRLAGGGGVDGFIHRAAGAEDLQAECQSLNGCVTGDCKITGGYRLPAKYIIHCVGPIGKKPDLLSSCYRNALNTLVKNNLKTIAFPCISTGVYGYPNEDAALVAINTVLDWLETNSKQQQKIERVIFCLFLEIDVELYNRLMLQYFPKQ